MAKIADNLLGKDRTKVAVFAGTVKGVGPAPVDVLATQSRIRPLRRSTCFGRAAESGEGSVDPHHDRARALGVVVVVVVTPHVLKKKVEKGKRKREGGRKERKKRKKEKRERKTKEGTTPNEEAEVLSERERERAKEEERPPLLPNIIKQE